MEEARRAKLGRLKWHSRRALLELDIVLQRFWAAQGDDIDDRTADNLARLLELEDHDLWEVLSGRVESGDPEVAQLVGVLRKTNAGTLGNL